MNIENLKKEDASEIHKIGLRVNEFQTSEKPLFWSKDVLEAWIESKNDITICLKEKEEIVAFALVAVHLPTSKATFENMWVAPEHRAKGVSQEFIKKIIEELKNKNIGYVAGMVGLQNTASQAMLTAAGFQKGKEFYWFDKTLK